MAKSTSSAKTDPELIRQLDQASASEEPVGAVLRLRPGDPSQIVPSPEQTEQLAQKVLERVKKRVGGDEPKHNVFRNLGSFAIAAGPRFMRELLEQPEIASAMANRQPEDPSYEPDEPDETESATRQVKAQSARAARSPSDKKTLTRARGRKALNGKSAK
jgi:hypothetical protein